MCASVDWVIIGLCNGLAPSHYLHQWRLLVNWVLGHKLLWDLNRNTKNFSEENIFEMSSANGRPIRFGLNMLMNELMLIIISVWDITSLRGGETLKIDASSIIVRYIMAWRLYSFVCTLHYLTIVTIIIICVHWTYQILVIYILSSVCLRLSQLFLL